MQREFRTHFSTRVDEKLLGRLERREREALQRLWAVSLSMFHEPTGTRKAAGVRELSRIRSKEERFLLLLQEKTSECMSGLGTVRIDRNPQVIGEASGLAIICDFLNAEASETKVALLHQAIGEAAFSEEWKLFEGQEIVEKWREVILVPRVNGKVLSPVIYRLDMATLLAKAALSKQEVPILVPAGVDHADLERNGFSCWQFPGLSPLRELRGTLFGLNWTLAAYSELVNHALENRANRASLDRGRPVFQARVGEMNRELTPRCGEVVDSLKSTCPDLAEEAGVELREIQVRCTSLSELFEDRAEPERVKLEITPQRQLLEEATQVAARLFFNVADRMTK